MSSNCLDRSRPGRMGRARLVDFPVKPEARPYLDAFSGTAGEPEWLARFRQQGLNRFAELGFPSRRSESWRYLDLQPLEKHPMLPAVMGEPMGVPAELALDGIGLLLVLIDGRFAPELSRLDAPSRRLVRLDANGDRRTAGAGRDAAGDNRRPSVRRAQRRVLRRRVRARCRAWRRRRAADRNRPPRLGRGRRVAAHAQPDQPGRRQPRDGHRNLCRLRKILAQRCRRVADCRRRGADPHRADRGKPRRRCISARSRRRSAPRRGSTGSRCCSAAAPCGTRPTSRIAGDQAECRYDGAFVVSGREEANIVTAIDHAAVGGTTTRADQGRRRGPRRTARSRAKSSSARARSRPTRGRPAAI